MVPAAVVAALACGMLLAGCAAGAAAVSASGRYADIAEAGNKRLDADFDRMDGRDRGHLAATEADLRDAAATERLFDRRLAAIAFPARARPVVRVLHDDNESRAALTTAAASATTLRQLAGYQRRLTAANAPVEQAVDALRGQLRLPPPDVS